jgi:hypothetical protein
MGTYKYLLEVQVIQWTCTSDTQEKVAYIKLVR